MTCKDRNPMEFCPESHLITTRTFSSFKVYSFVLTTYSNKKNKKYVFSSFFLTRGKLFNRDMRANVILRTIDIDLSKRIESKVQFNFSHNLQIFRCNLLFWKVFNCHHSEVGKVSLVHVLFPN